MDTSKPRETDRQTDRQRLRDRLIDWLIKLYFSKVKILGQRPTHIISAVATVLLITKTFIV